MNEEEINKHLDICFNHIHSKVKASNSSGEGKGRATLSSTAKLQSLSDKDSGGCSKVGEQESGFKSDGELEQKQSVTPYVSSDKLGRASMSVGKV